VSHAVVDVLMNDGEVGVLRSLPPSPQEGCFEVEEGRCDDTTLSASRHVGIINDINTPMTVRATFMVVGSIMCDDASLGVSRHCAWSADELGSDDILWSGLSPLEDIPHLESEGRLPIAVECLHLVDVDVGDGCRGWNDAVAHGIAVVLCLLLTWPASLAGIPSYAPAPRAPPSAHQLVERMGLG